MVYQWVQKESNLRRLRYEQSILPLNYEPGRLKRWSPFAAVKSLMKHNDIINIQAD
jgi:hypothetical protein